MWNSIPAVLLAATCAVVLGGILVAGLWPFHAPNNQVSWLGASGLSFGEYGSIVSAATFQASETKEGAPCSLEIWLQPAMVHYSGTILAFYWPENHHVPFALRQSVGDLLIQRISLDRLQHTRRTKIYVDDFFNGAKSVFVTISSGPAGTAVYADGTLVKKAPDFRFSRQHLTGQLIIGNTPATTHNWPGQLKGLAVYDHELTADEVSQHFASWTKNKQTDLAKSQGVVALYLFNEGNGRVVHNQIDAVTDLLIPERFFVLREKFLELPWSEFHPGWSYWKNIGINIAGFIPFGFFFCAYLSSVRKIKRATEMTIVLGFIVSLTIEVLQAFLPTRDSGTTDLITNTFGTALGGILCARSMKHNWFSQAGVSVGSSIGGKKDELQLVK